MTSDAETLLSTVAVAIGRAEFERRGAPESVQPRHYEDARDVLLALSSALRQQGSGARARLANETASRLGAASRAPGPDQPEGIS